MWNQLGGLMGRGANWLQDQTGGQAANILGQFLPGAGQALGSLSANARLRRMQPQQQPIQTQDAGNMPVQFEQPRYQEPPMQQMPGPEPDEQAFAM